MSSSLKNISVNRHEEFRALALEYCGYASEAGISLRPFDDPALVHFSKKLPQEQVEIVSALAACVRICDQTRASGHEVKDSPSLIWHALKEFGFRPPSDFFSYVTHENVIEIHSPEGVQLFRNFSFYKYCSYTIEDLYCGSWNSLYEREERILPLIFNLAKGVFSGEIRTTVPMRISRHIVKETSSRYRYEVELDLTWVAPLYAEGTSQAVATIVIESAQLVGQAARAPSRPRAEQESPLFPV